MGRPNPKTDRELAIEIAKLLKQRKGLKEIRAALAIGERRLARILSQGKALKPEPPKPAVKASLPKAVPAPKKPAPKPAPKKAEAPKAAPKKCGKKCQPVHVHALAIESPLLPKFLMALEFACFKIFSLGVEQGKKEKAAAKPPKK